MHDCCRVDFTTVNLGFLLHNLKRFQLFFLRMFRGLNLEAWSGVIKVQRLILFPLVFNVGKAGFCERGILSWSYIAW